MDEKLLKILQDKETVILTGAGVSTDSGIQCFKTLYKEKYMGFSPELILSHHFMLSHYRVFIKFVFENIVKDLKPNKIHQTLAKICPNTPIFTQNIDGLHQKAGSLNVTEIHGSMNTWHNLDGQTLDLETIKILYEKEELKDMFRPDIVLYGEFPDFQKLVKAEKTIEQAKNLVVLGTRLLVQPFATLLERFQGKNLIICNDEPTPYDHIATKVCRQNLSDLFDLDIKKQSENREKI